MGNEIERNAEVGFFAKPLNIKYSDIYHNLPFIARNVLISNEPSR